MAQTTVQNANDLYLQDVKVMWADYQASPTVSTIKGASWVDIGALAEAGKEPNITFVTPAALNVKHNKVMENMEVTINLTLQEIGRDNLERLSGGVIKTEDVAGTPVAGATQTVAAGYTYKKFIKIDNQNGDGSAITVNSVTQDPSGTPAVLVADTDYYVGQNDLGEYGIYLIDTATVDNTFAAEIDYDYTPNSISRAYLAETNNTNPFMLRFIATMTDGRTIDIYYPRVSYTSGLEIIDQAYDSTDYKNMPFSGVAELHDNFKYNDNKVVYFREYYTV